MVTSNQQLFNERVKRIKDAIELRKPDRVPISIPFSYFPAKFTGTVTPKDSWYDFKKWKEAYFKTADYYQPDACGLAYNNSGKVLEAVGSKTLVWPGHGVSIHHSHQFVEGEYMKADEYDLFINDLSDYLVRYFLPRTYGLLEPLKHLPPLANLAGGLPFANLATPEFADMTVKLLEIAKEAVIWSKEVVQMSQEMNDRGYLGRGLFLTSMAGLVPFDTLSDSFRGMRGAMLDMYRQPDKLLAAINKLSDMQIKTIAAAPQATAFTTTFIPLHRGSDGFMSLKQFEIFYFPYLKRLVEALVAKGYTPHIFFEGDYTQRLEYLRQLPKGKVWALFDRPDMKKAKEVLNGHMCISGNMPSSILQTGTVDDVKKACKWLIDVVGKDGGYIMAPGSSVDEAKPENMKAMVEFTKEYGRY
ncbi:MAG TPA: uroporphyrinogen decarboxylase family protein [Dehalococcoidales bacterium]|nr:uroporphyrinogen decarboxylase family protein [Dehalococcoidales bacterium]